MVQIVGWPIQWAGGWLVVFILFLLLHFLAVCLTETIDSNIVLR